jgi:4-phospho-D-threonate 3-dehydrogenase / 4-phospho-D-erythronate 3-dehydrogenase
LTTAQKKPRIATVIGDPTGIGPEVCVKALATGEPQAHSDPILIGNLEALEHAARICAVDVRFRVVARAGFVDLGDYGAVAVLDPGDLDESDYTIGQPSGRAARAGIEWIRLAQELATNGEIAGFVMGPMNHESLALSGIAKGFSDVPEFEPPGTWQLRVNGSLRAVPLTEHVRLREIPQTVKTQAILALIVMVDRHLRRWGIARPRIAVAGLNPHAMFEEDTEQIAPAVAAAREAGIEANGPVSPDAVFRQGLEGRSDAVVTMYHDQGQIAVKTAAFEGACTVFLNLPYVRIGIPHGTAYDIAGTGKAQHLTMLSAMNTAAALASGRGFLT